MQFNGINYVLDKYGAWVAAPASSPSIPIATPKQHIPRETVVDQRIAALQTQDKKDIPEAPRDHKSYVRKDANWVEDNGTILFQTVDVSSYGFGNTMPSALTLPALPDDLYPIGSYACDSNRVFRNDNNAWVDISPDGDNYSIRQHTGPVPTFETSPNIYNYIIDVTMTDWEDNYAQYLYLGTNFPNGARITLRLALEDSQSLDGLCVAPVFIAGHRRMPVQNAETECRYFDPNRPITLVYDSTTSMFYAEDNFINKKGDSDGFRNGPDSRGGNVGRWTHGNGEITQPFGDNLHLTRDQLNYLLSETGKFTIIPSNQTFMNVYGTYMGSNAIIDIYNQTIGNSANAQEFYLSNDFAVGARVRFVDIAFYSSTIVLPAGHSLRGIVPIDTANYGGGDLGGSLAGKNINTNRVFVRNYSQEAGDTLELQYNGAGLWSLQVFDFASYVNGAIPWGNIDKAGATLSSINYVAPTVTNSAATDITGLLSDYNGLLAALRTAGILSA